MLTKKLANERLDAAMLRVRKLENLLESPIHQNSLTDCKAALEKEREKTIEAEERTRRAEDKITVLHTALSQSDYERGLLIAVLAQRAGVYATSAEAALESLRVGLTSRASVRRIAETFRSVGLIGIAGALDLHSQSLPQT